ncbi:uncharacterized mitochondrial protein AtMg00810-like [Solanum tuberosum]|uniref:uncharacterized mitochondrial protein AtMg00810-like n=1 Tax=Solanum tuberosum TaxID=4113 RepID=UPI00073A2793|nr:PREDICTED: uncharacterized mitochondrial protein AtMg00810-like [Solanum tuberosum]
MPVGSEGVSVTSSNSQTLSSPSLPPTITPPPDYTQPPTSSTPLMISSKGATTSMISTTILTASMNDPSADVTKLSQFMDNQHQSHWKAVKRLHRYLCHTYQYGIQIFKAPSSHLVIYSDSDWASDPNDHTSTYGYITFMSITPISWSFNKQFSVTRPTTKAEYRVVAAAIAETN